MAKKRNSVLPVILFVVVFGALLLTATFTDLNVSKILTNGVLPAGQYYANDFYGVMMECVGTSPVYLLAAFIFQIWFWYIKRFNTKHPLAEILCGLFAILSVVADYICVNDTVGYVFEHYGVEKDGFLDGISIFYAVIITVFSLLAVRNFSDENLKKLNRFAFAALGMIVLGNAFVNLVKIPMGRMRFRAMNTIGDYSGFTKWFIANGQPDKAEMIALYGTADAFKSFPSGHTCAAGMSYSLIMLIDLFDIKSKGKKAAIWLGTIAFTGMVAVSRIMVGAHFFSDVLMGGTIAFLCMVLFRELIVRKGSKK